MLTCLSAQGTVLAGGRYTDLVHEMGGPNVPGVGYACFFHSFFFSCVRASSFPSSFSEYISRTVVNPHASSRTTRTLFQFFLTRTKR